MPISFNEINENAFGGTEVMARRLESSFTKEELDHVQIIPSRVRELDNSRVRVFWCHDLPADPESENVLRNEGWEKFEKLVFVSNWQKQQYISYYGIPYSKCIVLQNAIDPISYTEKDKSVKSKIRLIYHTTPHRGLNLAYHAVDQLSKKYGSKLQFDVFSSFEIYGWKERNEQFEDLFEAIRSHKNMKYHGTVPNDVVRKHLQKAHIFAYPSIWPETSCISLMEAMSAGCLSVHSDLAALPETAANWTYMYNYQEEQGEHLNLFISCLDAAIQSLIDEEQRPQMLRRLQGQSSYAGLYYNWELRKIQWGQFIESLKDVNPVSVEDMQAFKEEDEFVYGI